MGVLRDIKDLFLILLILTIILTLRKGISQASEYWRKLQQKWQEIEKKIAKTPIVGDIILPPPPVQQMPVVNEKGQVITTIPIKNPEWYSHTWKHTRITLD